MVILGIWSTGVQPTVSGVALPNSQAEYSYKTAYDGTDGYTIVSVGTDRNRSRTINARLRLKGLFENAIQCRDTVILKSGTIIDAIDSTISMDPADCSEKVKIGTNSTQDDRVILNSGVVVDGDVVVGVGGDTSTVIKDLGGTYDSSYSLSTPVEFPPVYPPSIFGPDMGIFVPIGGTMTIGPGGDFPATGRFSGITLRQGATLEVDGDCTLYITGDIRMGQNSEIIIDDDNAGKLTIYVDGDWVADNSSSVTNESEKASSFKLYATGPVGQKIDMKAKSEFYGVIYAPDADLTMYSGGSIYGSFVANNFELKNPASFLYDVSLKTVSVFEEGARFVVNRWREL
jgi:hypothetical protein